MIISFVLGTRPEVIKLAPLIQVARQQGHEVKVVLTGQHRHLTGPLLKFFGVSTDYDLDTMAVNQSLSSLTAKIIEGLEKIRSDLSSDYLVVQGDTTSAFAAAYWAFVHRIRVAHVEAGLRTRDLASPFPEEANRQLITRIANLHFAPTERSARELELEGVDRGTIHVVGNTAIDALRYAVKRIREPNAPAEEGLDSAIQAFADSAGAKGKLVLVTAHRRENLGPALKRICRALYEIAEADPSVRIVYPVHPNPLVRGPVSEILGRIPQILLCEPLSYVAFVALMSQAHVLLTDSGGVQEEGPTLKKPILVMRDTTERPEGVEAGFAKLVGTDSETIRNECLAALRDGSVPDKVNPYGDGESSERILRVMARPE